MSHRSRADEKAELADDAAEAANDAETEANEAEVDVNEAETEASDPAETANEAADEEDGSAEAAIAEVLDEPRQGQGATGHAQKRARAANASSPDAGAVTGRAKTAADVFTLRKV